MFYRPWETSRPDAADVAALSEKTGLTPLVCGVLCARGINTPEAAQAFLGEDVALSNPMLMHGMQDAVTRILRAVDNGERIVVFGDYDVDGVTATALLYTYLDALGADVYYKLPARDDEGYGLNESAVLAMAQKGVTLIVTVDNGVSANEPIAMAKENGIDVVVTDHHLPPDVLPDAVAIVDPRLAEDESPCKELSGAGVAFKLAVALEGCDAEEMTAQYGDLAAIGTVADIMRLTGENRAIVKAGLRQLQHTDRPGLAALIEHSGMGEKPITADSVSFGLAPRLNAAGRMDSASAALELLLCEDPEDADARAAGLCEQNTARQSAEQDILQSVLQAIEADPTYASDRILVVAGEEFHPGVIGIVASRIVERFGKPAIIISIDAAGEGKGSGRSVAGISLYDAIAACSDLLVRFGGHAQAAGLSVEKANIPALRRAINVWAAKEHAMPHRPALHLDAPVRLAKLGTDDVAALDVLAPFGSGNPAPLFCLENATVEAVYPVSEGKHSRLRLRQGEASLYAVCFGMSPQALPCKMGDAVDVALSLSVYEGKAGAALSGRIKDLRPAGMDNSHVAGAELYEAMCYGAQLTPEQKEQLRPARENTVALYRRIAAGGVSAEDLRPLFAQMGEGEAGKTLVSLRALEQLGLVRREGEEARYVCVPQQGKEKKDLASAPVLAALA